MSSGMQVPLVLLPRFSTFAGVATFRTLPLDVSAYVNVSLNIWRAALCGTAPTYAITIEESTDQVTWSTVSGTTASYDPGSDTEGPQNGALRKRWMRATIVLAGANPVATCWAIGFLEQRQG